MPQFLRGDDTYDSASIRRGFTGHTPQMLFRPTTLVLSSGGVRGVAHVGALRALFDAGWLGDDSPRTIIGTSAGAVVGALCVLGYTPREMWRVVRHTNLLSLLRREQRRLTLSGVLSSLATRFGAIDSSKAKLEGLIRTLVARSRVADGNPDLTFGELRRRTGRTLIVCATDLIAAGPIYFGPCSTPDTAVAYAVRASAAIPLVFTPVDGRYTDGALVDHYPFYRSPDDAGRTLGVVLVDGEEDHPSAGRTPRTLLDYTALLVRAVETSRTRALLDNIDVLERTIVVYCPRGETNDAAVVNERESSLRRAEALYRRGKAAATAFIATQSGRGGVIEAALAPTARARLARALAARRREYSRAREAAAAIRPTAPVASLVRNDNNRVTK